MRREGAERVGEGVVDVQPPHNQRWYARVREQGFWWNGVDSTVSRVDGVGVNQSKGVKAEAQKGFLGGDVTGHKVGPFCEPWQH